ncbi:MAG: hypothetical protein ISN29_01455 [Gammaproteobacteria bacterium AqS3]|nr:hypothetical protein [Gammaproteobacteria bacterium AqS3]
MLYYVIMKRAADGKEFNVGFYLHERNAKKFIARHSDGVNGNTYRIIESDTLLRHSEMDDLIAKTA